MYFMRGSIFRIYGALQIKIITFINKDNNRQRQR